MGKTPLCPMNLTPMEKKAVLLAINVFANQATMARLTEDIKIYIEACIARQKLQGNVVMLVTDDHKFFRVCARSVITENILMGQVQTLVKEARPCDRNGVGDPFWLCMKSGMAVCPQLPQWRYTLLHNQQWWQHKTFYYSSAVTKKHCSTFSYTTSKEAYKTETHHPSQLESIVELNLVNPVLQRCLWKRN